MRVTSVITANKIRACILANKYIDKDSCEIFEDYFVVQKNETDTRNTMNEQCKNAINQD